MTVPTRARRPESSPRANGLAIARPAVLGFAKILTLGLSTASAAPLAVFERAAAAEPNPGDSPVWVLYIASVVLVLLGGAFAGLTIALMGQDDIYLRVLSTDNSEPQRKNAKRVYDLLHKGKHWVLVTLLLSNVIVNETLPVVLDRCLGGGVAAVVGSTFLIVIFGEILPQSVCVRYGLPIGGFMSKPVLLLMYLMAPVAWPTAKLLDWLLGEDHGTVYKKSGLKTLVTLHKSLGDVSQRLNQDEVTIISAVLDLKEKAVEQVMTPMEDVFVMSADTVLDEKMMNIILSAGYSRIPIHEPGKPTNFVGMLLVKMLISYDPEDCNIVRDFPLATLPETRPETSCLDIVNFFQEGKSHMVLVSEQPGEDHGALGVVTLEDVIEELIGEEIVDESDVYIDVHKAIRRLTPAPHARLQRKSSTTENGAGKSSNELPTVSDEWDLLADIPERPPRRVGTVPGNLDKDGQSQVGSPKTATFMMRRSSAGPDGKPAPSAVAVRANIEEMRQHLRHLGPSNPATNPKNTRSTTVKIKPGVSNSARTASISGDPAVEEIPQDEGDETTTLLRPKIKAKDGIQALRQSYGSIAPDAQSMMSDSAAAPIITLEAPDADVPPIDQHDHATQTSARPSQMDLSSALADSKRPSQDNGTFSLQSDQNSNMTPLKQRVRSGSLTENVVETRGIRKVVLETTSSNDDEGEVGVFLTSEVQSAESPPGGRSNSTDFLIPAAPEQAAGEESAGSETTVSPGNVGGGPSSESASRNGENASGSNANGASSNGAKSGGGSGKKKNKKKKKGGKS